jgi:hypothetical protein
MIPRSGRPDSPRDERAASSGRSTGERLLHGLQEYPAASAAVVALLIAAGLIGTPLCTDVGYQLWVAHQLRLGARLYIDIWELNPPLWYWMAIPVDGLSGLLGVPAAAVLVMAIGVAVALSLAAASRLLDHVTPRSRLFLLGYAALTMLLMPQSAIGQREQIAFIAAFPYILLVAARRRGQAVSMPLAFAIGAGAAIGFALKHYFLIVPIGLEAALIVGNRRSWRPFRPETLAVIAVGAAYAIAMGLFARAYFTTMVPLLTLAYGATGNSWHGLFSHPIVILWLATFALWIVLRRAIGRTVPLADTLAIAALSFAGAWAIQHKGWPYQAIAASGCMSMALLALLVESRVRPSSLGRVACTLLLALPAVAGPVAARLPNAFTEATKPVADGIHAGDAVVFISPDPAFAWPFVEDHGLRYPTRHPTYWMLPAIVNNERYGHDARLAQLGRDTVMQTVMDFRCMPPRRIAFDRPIDIAPGQFDILKFFGRDPGFTGLMQRYRRVSRTPYLDIYDRVGALPPPGAVCRRSF